MQNILNAELTEIKHLLLMNSKNVLTSTEVSMMYGISPDYLYHLTSDKLIPYYKPNGKKIYFLKEGSKLGCCGIDRIPLTKCNNR